MEIKFVSGGSVESTEVASASWKRRRLWAHLRIRRPKCLSHSLFFGGGSFNLRTSSSLAFLKRLQIMTMKLKLVTPILGK